MKKIFLVSLAIVLVSGLVFWSSAIAAPQEPIKLKFAYWPPPVCPPAVRILHPWGERIEERTNGRVKVTFYPAEALGKAPDHYDLCLKGTADIVWIDPNFTPGVFPLIGVIALPMQFPKSEVAGAVFWELMEKYMADTEFKKVKVLWVYPTGLFQLWTRKKQVRKLEDLKGMKLSCTSDVLVKITKALGAVPVFMPEPDIYTSLERGLLDGRWHEWEGGWTWKAHEVTKYRTANVDLGTNTNVIMMNLDSWNKLPRDIQKIVDECSGLKYSQYSGKVWDETNVEFLPKIIDYDKKAGNPEIYYISDSERARWKEAVTPVYDEWVNEMEAKGLPGKAILKDLRALVKKYSQ